MADLRRSRRERTSPDGAMSLAAHLRELRRRLLISLLAIGIGTAVGWMYYQQIFDFIRGPFDDLSEEVSARGLDVSLTLTGIADPFLLQFKVAAFAGLLLASPIWIYQAWGFVSPGLHGHERRWALGITAAAVPLFLLGVLMAYVIVPQGLTILVGFTPEGVSNLIAVDRYLSFLLRLAVVFGIAFLLPVFVVGLNAAGVLTGAQIASSWRVVVFAIFLFSAIATPTPDPLTMMLLATPMLFLFGLSLVLTRLIDRRRRREPDPLAGLSDDEASPLDL
jgi:sec-independent protein translocase protein TatC